MHIPVLLDETLELLNIRKGGRYIDGTLGGGGHSEAILERIGPQGRLLGIDRDEEALERCRERLKRFGDSFQAVHGNYADIASIAADAGMTAVDGVLLDLGVSSFQLDEAGRGFSFMQDGPLDMRMDRSRGRTAAEVVNHLPESELVRIFREYGEERSARKVAVLLTDGESYDYNLTVQEAEKLRVRTTISVRVHNHHHHHHNNHHKFYIAPQQQLYELLTLYRSTNVIKHT